MYLCWQQTHSISQFTGIGMNNVSEGYLRVFIRVVCDNESKRPLNQSGLHGNALIWHTDMLYFLRAAAAQADL
jgi:hypothetical protein